MNGRITYLVGAPLHRSGWSKQEIMHLHRAVRAIWAAGVALEIDGGVTDEGDPWLVFCDATSGEVLAHFARISGKYVACASFLNGSLSARIFPELIARFLDRCQRRQVALGRNNDNTRLAVPDRASVSSLLQLWSATRARRATLQGPTT